MSTITSMTDLDVEMHTSGVRLPVTVGPTLRRTGWRGGLWVMYVTTVNDDFVVEASDGTMAAGFLLSQSENYAITPPGDDSGSIYNYSSRQPGQNSSGTAHNVVTMCSDGRALFKFYEKYALVAGVRGNTLTTYTLNESLYVSENGLLCNDSTVELGLAGIAEPIFTGIVSAVPSARTKNRLGADFRL